MARFSKNQKKYINKLKDEAHRSREMIVILAIVDEKYRKTIIEYAGSIAHD